MRVAFDLDDTLIPCGLDFPTEAPALPWLAWLLRPEPLRVGTTAALAALRADGHELWVYTSSFRSALLFFWLPDVTRLPVWRQHLPVFPADIAPICCSAPSIRCWPGYRRKPHELSIQPIM